MCVLPLIERDYRAHEFGDSLLIERQAAEVEQSEMQDGNFLKRPVGTHGTHRVSGVPDSLF